ncbi:L,D-transpeptidase [Fodinibius sediminis]|uniref:L,D-transpeptidase ErfK/SrfK n=1 Tax=Fodinibius sediminis TaxID=1214077 RepID=A0A521CZ03_9BACT|nr:L,D-transpeptidase [Fodinibius sediminis]SMO64677.1 L,D-transpeptidase ErfK/SrfK [Fodinibius sediminis]
MITRGNIWILLATALLLLAGYNKGKAVISFNASVAETSANRVQPLHLLEDTVKVKDYFEVMDDIVHRYDSLLSYPVSEHLIIRNNPWVIDSLAATDYYHLKERGITNLDPKELPIFRPGQHLVIPDSAAADSLNRLFKQTYLDLNIPEFKLRVRQGERTVYEFPVRVGRDERKYLAMAGRVMDLRTRSGEGTIVRHIKNPVFINPVNNHVYHVTRRDDGTVTRLPNIPWLEPEINGVRYGQLIHPTTNIETLGKAYSNGCIGTSEAAAWYLYYYAPPGTRIVIRYDLEIVDENGRTTRLQNVYSR